MGRSAPCPGAEHLLQDVGIGGTVMQGAWTACPQVRHMERHDLSDGGVSYQRRGRFDRERLHLVRLVSDPAFQDGIAEPGNCAH